MTGYYRGSHRGQRLVIPGTYTPVHSVTLSPATINVVALATQQMTATVRDAGNNILQNRVVNWASNNTAIATVNAFGLVTGVAAGNCTITATCEGVNANAACTVTAQNVVSASQSSVSATSPANTGTNSTVTVTARRSDNTVLAGQSVTLAVSGSNNTVNQPGATTDVNGVATGSFSSTTAETKTVTAIAGGVTISQQPSVVVQSGPTPILSEHFNWASQAAFLADTTIYSNEDPYNTDASTNLLNTSPVFGNGVKSYQGMYFAKPGVCADNTPCGRNLKLPSTQAEIWVDSYWIFSNGFTTDAGCPDPPGKAQKLLFGRTFTSRFQVIAGSNGGQIWETGYPGNEEPTAGQVPTSTFNMSQFADGSTVLRIRTHWRIASSGVVCELWMQNTKVISLSGDSSVGSGIYGIAYLRNLNQGPPADQSIRVGSIDVYNQDPGW